MSRKIDKREIAWAIQRMTRIVKIWDKLAECDKKYLLTRWRDKEGWRIP